MNNIVIHIGEKIRLFTLAESLTYWIAESSTYWAAAPELPEPDKDGYYEVRDRSGCKVQTKCKLEATAIALMRTNRYLFLKVVDVDRKDLAKEFDRIFKEDIINYYSHLNADVADLYISFLTAIKPYLPKRRSNVGTSNGH
jgi:hypothetical protein